jgi:hypothetical protein
MKKIILSLSVFTFVTFAQDSLPVTEAPVSDSVPSAAPEAVQKEAPQGNLSQTKSTERSPASAKKKHHAKKRLKKKHKKNKKTK